MEKEKEKEKTTKVADKTQKGSKRKKSMITSPITNFFAATPKKVKLQNYTLPSDISDLIDKDVVNDKLWCECKEVLGEGKQAFLSKVEELFMCICCQEIVCKPVSTPCNHNMCKVSVIITFSIILTMPLEKWNLNSLYSFNIPCVYKKEILTFINSWSKTYIKYLPTM